MKIKLELVQGDVNCISGNPSNGFFSGHQPQFHQSQHQIH